MWLKERILQEGNSGIRKFEVVAVALAAAVVAC